MTMRKSRARLILRAKRRKESRQMDRWLRNVRAAQSRLYQSNSYSANNANSGAIYNINCPSNFNMWRGWI